MTSFRRIRSKWRLVVPITLLSLLLIACGQTKSTTKSTTASSSKSSNSSTIAKRQQAATSKSKITPHKVSWNKSKEAQLSKFMHQWQAEMDQSYQGTYDQQIPDHLGVKFPEAITDGSLNQMAFWLGESVHFSWGLTQGNSTNIDVLAAASGGADKQVWPRTYLFCLHHHRPVVLTTTTTNGGQVYFYDTQNSTLQAGFSKIVTGESANPRSDAELNQDVATSLTKKPQQFPTAYQGTWYWYDDTDAKIQQYTLKSTSGLALNYYETAQPQWLNVKGAQQTAGAGSDFYLRYRYYDGQQIPVMIKASGASQWFDFNAYQTPELAQKFKNYRFGDEPADRESDN